MEQAIRKSFYSNENNRWRVAYDRFNKIKK